MIGKTNGGGRDRFRPKVYGGTTAPANPKNGDFWIYTSGTITGVEWNSWTHRFPDFTMTDGFAYIVSGGYNGDIVVDLSAVRNGLYYFCPNVCYMQHGGKWYRETAYVYQNNEWRQFSTWAQSWDGTLFDNGDQYTYITGGWTLSKFSLKDGAFDTGLTSETSGNDVMACTVNKIDVGQFSTLHIQCYSNFRNSGGPGNSRFGICSTNGPSYDNFAAYKDISTGSNNISYYSIDISSVTGTYYVKFYASVAYQMGWLKIEKMWLT